MPSKRVILSAVLPAFLLAGLPGSAIPQARDRSNPALAQWRSVLPLIKADLKGSCEVEDDEHNDVDIVDASEIIPDGPSVALVDYCQSGAYTDDIDVMRMVHGRPIDAIFRDAKGKRILVGFLQGSSVMHSEDVQLSPDKKTILGFSMEKDEDDHISSCKVDAYVWNPATKTFDWNAAASNRAARDWCRS